MEQITIVITESAYNDLADIEVYISKDSPTIARKFISKIFNKIDMLYQFPEIGKRVHELRDDSIRELLINKYRIVYQIIGAKHINIIRIVHSSRILDIEI